MDLENVISELREEKELVEAAIVALERLAAGSGKRRGRPPKWLTAMTEAEKAPEQPARKRAFSAETRKKMSEAQRKRFAAKAEGA